MKRNRDDVPIRNYQETEGNRLAQFEVNNISRFDVNFPVFQRPKCVGYFSLDEQRQYHPDASQLRFLHLPPSRASQIEWRVRFDLRSGIQEAVEKDQEKVKNHMLDDMLTWILQERKAKHSFVINVDSPLRTLETEFVCFRGLLTLISCTPYLPQDSWSILATQFQKTVYLWQLKEGDDCHRNPRLREMALWGFKFEQYLCAGSPTEEPDPSSQLDTNAEFCCVVKTRLGGHSLLFGAEVDAVTKSDSKPPWNSLEDFVELKTNRMIETQRQETSFRRFKLLKWWAQSFIVGIPTIVCGYRDDDGMVTKLESLSVQQLPTMAKGIWNSNVCMNFCQRFLEFVQKTVTTATDAHFIFEYDARRKAISARHAAAEEMPRSLLPPWYTEAMSKPV